MSKYVYGIDLGTTYSCIAYQDENGMPVVVKNSEGDNTTPSVISMAGDEPVVGQVAKDSAVFDAAYTLSLVKNKIGRKDENGDPVMIYYGEEAEKEISPTTASSYTLKKLAQDAGKMLDDEVASVVITCPAYFNAEQKAQTKQAGIEAGLNVLSVIDEPTAAAICYGCSRDVEGQTFLVYDLGGGTFDITVMRVENGKFTVVCSEGNHDLGGALWDQAIYDYVENQYREKTDDQEEFQLDIVQDLSLKSEKAKKMLTGSETTAIPIITENGKAKVEITRETFDDITSTLLEETITLTKKAIAVAQGFATKKENDAIVEKSLDEIIDSFDANFRPSEIDQILLVGGSTRMPQIEKKVKEVFGIKTQAYDPDEAVAKGAAIYACLADMDMDGEPEQTEMSGNTSNGGNEADEVEIHERATLSQAPVKFQGDTLGGGKKTDIVETIVNKSYGIVVTTYNEEWPDGHECINNLILRDTRLPHEVTETYSLSSDSQKSIWLRLCEVTTRDEYAELEDQFIIFNQEYDIPENLSSSTPVDVKMSLQKDGTLDIEIRIAGKVMTGQHMVSVE